MPLLDVHSTKTVMKVKRTTAWSKIRRGFCDSKKLDPVQVRVQYDGERVNCNEGGETINDYADAIEENIGEDDQYFYVDAYLEQQGGGGVTLASP